MSNKKRVKKNNSAVRANRLSTSFVSGLLVAKINSDVCHIIEEGKIVRPFKHLTNCFERTKFRWTILLIVGCRESNGKFKLVTDQITFSDPKRQEELTPFLAQEHCLLAQECESKMTVEYVGWIGSPVKTEDFDLKQVEEIFAKLLMKAT